MHKQLITPPEIKAKAQAVLALLDGLSFFEAGYVLDEAQILLARVRRRLDGQKFSFDPACSPKDGGDRP